VADSGRLLQRSYETEEGEKRTVYEAEVDDVSPSLRERLGQGQPGCCCGEYGGGQRSPAAARAATAAAVSLTRGRPAAPAGTLTSYRRGRDRTGCMGPCLADGQHRALADPRVTGEHDRTRLGSRQLLDRPLPPVRAPDEIRYRLTCHLWSHPAHSPVPGPLLPARSRKSSPSVARA
jgi:hypothetical protein